MTWIDALPDLTGWALCLGGGVFQTGIIRQAKMLGLKTLVADISAECAGRELADRFVQMDTNDRQGLLEIARRQGVRMVLAEQTDRVVPVAAYLNEQLNLNGIRLETAIRFTNKFAMRQALEDSGVFMPHYAAAASGEEAADFARHWGYPVVLKPKSSQASLGVFKVENEHMLLDHVPLTVQHSQDGTFLVEEFISGTEITVESFSLAGECTVLAVSEKDHYAFNPCIAYKLTYPPLFPLDVLARINREAAKVVDTLGLQDGISHAEYRVREGIPYLVEVGARGGGNGIASMIVPHISGVNIYELLIRRLAGQQVEMPARLHRSANLEFFQFEPGLVKAIRGVQQALAEGYAQELVLSFKAGERIGETTDDRHRPGYFIVLGENRQDVDERSARVRDLVQVEYASI